MSVSALATAPNTCRPPLAVSTLPTRTSRCRSPSSRLRMNVEVHADGDRCCCCRSCRPVRGSSSEQLADPQRMVAQCLRAPTGVNGQQVLQYRLRRRDRSSGRKGELAVGPTQVLIGIAMANTSPSRCDCRHDTEIWEAGPSIRRTALPRGSAPASPSGDIFRRSTGNMAAAVHGGRPAWKRPLVERSPGAASLRARSGPGSQYRQDLPAGRSPPDRCPGGGHIAGRNQPQHPSHPVFPQQAIDPTEPTSRVVIPPNSLDTPGISALQCRHTRSTVRAHCRDKAPTLIARSIFLRRLSCWLRVTDVKVRGITASSR